ncbi:hypothetical protein F52700_6342 [Fusarium sp. NRRL 52700]|nr:hypothetical protein F52700_6342 [Fusarium sp. NRRL 52700]
MRNPLMSNTFCQKLRLIMTHPLFPIVGSHRLIPLVITWAAMCRVKDPNGFSRDEVKILEHVGIYGLEGHDAKKPCWDRFTEGLKSQFENGLFMTPHAFLFRNVVKLTTSEDEGVLKVKTANLSVIIDALEMGNGTELQVLCEVYWELYVASRSVMAYPSGLEEFMGVYKLCWMNAERRDHCRKRSMEEGPGRHTVSPSPDGDPAQATSQSPRGEHREWNDDDLEFNSGDSPVGTDDGSLQESRNAPDTLSTSREPTRLEAPSHEYSGLDGGMNSPGPVIPESTNDQIPESTPRTSHSGGSQQTVKVEDNDQHLNLNPDHHDSLPYGSQHPPRSIGWSNRDPSCKRNRVRKMVCTSQKKGRGREYTAK